MAIRPEIALEAGKVPKVDIAQSLGNVMKLGQLALQPEIMRQQLSAAKIAEQQAQVTLDREKREEATRKRYAEITKANTKADPKTGRVSVDYRQIANIAASEGLDPTIVSDFLAKAQSTEQQDIKTATDRKAYLERNRKTLDLNLRNVTDPLQAEQMLQKAIEQDAEHLKDSQALVGEFYSRYYPIGTNPIEQAKQNFKDTVQTEAERQQLEISAAEAEQRAAKEYTSKEARDPNSKQSVNMRQRLQSQGFDVPENASAFDISTDPILSKQLAGLVPSEGARIAAAEKLTGVESARETIKSGIDVANRITKQLAPTVLGTVLQSKLNQAIKQVPELGILKNAVAAHNQQFPDSPLDVNRDSLDTIITTLTSVESKLGKIAKKEKGIAVEPSLPKAIKGEEGGTVRIMRLSDGVIKSFPKAKADAFVATGQFKIVGK